MAAVCGPETVLATNTSSLRVAEIAAGVPDPERVVGMHFFNPPALMKLVEVVAAAASSEQALAAATEVAERMGRTPIRARDTPGFVANRLARPFSLESLRMLGDGVADAATIDRAVRLGGGFRMGPFELIDLIGLDVNLDHRPLLLRPGRRAGALAPEPDPGTAWSRKASSAARAARATTPTARAASARPTPSWASLAPTLDPGQLARIDPAATEILRRLFAQIANEAAFALEEGDRLAGGHGHGDAARPQLAAAARSASPS